MRKQSSLQYGIFKMLVCNKIKSVSSYADGNFMRGYKEKNNYLIKWQLELATLKILN